MFIRNILIYIRLCLYMYIFIYIYICIYIYIKLFIYLKLLRGKLVVLKNDSTFQKWQTSIAKGLD